MARKTTRAERSEQRQAEAAGRLEVFTELIGDSKRAIAMSDVDAFQAIRTGITSFNRATTVGGAPLSCVYLVHGPSQSGKTTFLLSMIESFVRAGGLAAFVDAEMAADTKRWFRQLGVDPSKVLYIGRTNVETRDADLGYLSYEEIVEEVDEFIERYRKAKREGRIGPRTPLLIIIDSISRMVPKSLLKSLAKDGGDALRSGIGRIQAQMNSAWLAELGVKVGDEPILLGVIAHEMEAQGAGKYEPDYKVKGGTSIVFDAMMRIRLVHAGRIYDAAAEDAEVVGKRHRITIMKNKHGPDFQTATFYTSNGAGIAPAGFDRTREVVHEAIERGLLEGPDPKKGLTLGARLSRGAKKFTLKQLFADPDYLAELAEALDRESLEKAG